jgi:MFS family permease
MERAFRFILYLEDMAGSHFADTTTYNRKLFFTIVIAALGYFVDVYELLLFTVVRVPSLTALGISPEDKKAMLAASTSVINWQMTGLLIGGIIWGVMGDKRGRLSVLLGSILLYSLASFVVGYVQTVQQYAWARFIGGIGLAGELGAGITLVSELMPKSKRGIGTSLVAGIGLSGAVFAYYMFQFTLDWRLCYKLGGVMGMFLLFLRIGLAESLFFEKLKTARVSKGNFLLFFTNRDRFRKYLLAILVGLPIWYVAGILFNFSNRFATDLYGSSTVDSGRATMFGYAATFLGDILVGIISQYFKSRKKALFLFYGITITGICLYFSPFNDSDSRMYAICALMGFGCGYWALFVTMGAEQFGTNLRATAATTIPNMVRGSVPLINFLFKDLFQDNMRYSLLASGVVTGVIVMAVTLLATFFTQETFHKDLDYLETEEMMP